MQLDHVVAFHQQVSPSVFHPDNFSSFVVESDIPESRSSNISYFTDLQLYSPDPSGTVASDPFTSVDNESLCESENSSFTGGHQVIVLSRPHFEYNLSKDDSYPSKMDELAIDRDPRTQDQSHQDQRPNTASHLNESESINYGCSKEHFFDNPHPKSDDSKMHLTRDTINMNNRTWTLQSRLRAPVRQLRRIIDRLSS